MAKMRELPMPSTSGFIEPSVKVVTKGRPPKKVDTSTHREPSAFEHALKSTQDSCSPKVCMFYFSLSCHAYANDTDCNNPLKRGSNFFYFIAR